VIARVASLACAVAALAGTARGEPAAAGEPARRHCTCAVPWIVVGASTLAAVAVGTTIGAVVAQHDALAIRDQLGAGNVSPARIADYNSDASLRDGLRAAAVVTGAAAVVGFGVAAGVYWRERRAARLVPVVGAHDAGIAITARF
jgi:hypothetical protein